MILARDLGKNGFGHETRLAWAGFLLRADVAPADLITMGEAISKHCNNTEVHDVKTVVNSTVASLKVDTKKVKGGPAPREAARCEGKARVSVVSTSGSASHDDAIYADRVDPTTVDLVWERLAEHNNPPSLFRRQRQS